MIWKTAWKNIWRNPVRSLVVISSVAVGIFASIFAVAMMNGMMAQRIDAALNEEISHIQITNRNFRLNNDPAESIENSEDVISRIKKVPGVSGVIGRTLLGGMANTPTKSVGVQIAGIDPEKEKAVFSLYQKVMPETGSFFEKDSKYNLALVGHDLAKDLNIIRFSIDSPAIGEMRKIGVPASVTDKLRSLIGVRFDSEKKFNRKIKSLLSPGDEIKYGPIIKKAAWNFRENSKITLTFLDRDNNQVGANFRVTGIFDVTNSMFEKEIIFVKDSDLKKLTRFENATYQQLIVRIEDVKQTETVTDNIRKALPEFEVKSWKELQPDLAMMSDMVYQIYIVLMIIILAALAFGIVNTMLMVVLERTKELGMLTAIGMNRRKVFSMIMLESVLMSLFGGIFGMILSKGVIILTARQGINFTRYSDGLEAFGYTSHIFPQIDNGFFVIVTILIIITGICSSVYPALKALRLNPADAIRTE
jgi:ABC-type lipoprotein release transport system permease subunit